MRFNGLPTIAILIVIASPTIGTRAEDKKLQAPSSPAREEAALITRLGETIHVGPVRLLRDRPVPDVMKLVLKPVHISYAVISEEFCRRKVSLDETDMSLQSFLDALAGEAGIYTLIGNCICIGTPKNVESLLWKRPILPDHPSEEDKLLLALLEKARITIYVESAGWSEHFELMARQVGANIMVDERAAGMMHVAPLWLDDVAFSTALRVRCGPALNYGVAHGIIYVSTDEDVRKLVAAKPMLPAQPTREDSDLLDRLRTKRMDVSFRDSVVLPEAAEYLRRKVGCQLAVDEKASTDRTMCFSLDGVTVDGVLRMMCGPDLNYGIKKGGIYIAPGDDLAKIMSKE